MIRRLTVATVVLTLIAGPVASQQHQHEEGRTETAVNGCPMMGHMMQGMMGNMMQMMTGEKGTVMMEAMQFLPDNVVRHKEVLKLTPEQVSRIEALRDAAVGSHGMASRPMHAMPTMRDMQGRQERVRAAFDRTPVDPAAIQAAMGELTALHGRMMADHLVQAARVREVLTPVQRDQLVKMPRCPM